jgi:PhnB protein
MPIQPYLAFNGRCEEAIEFYRKALGAEVNMMLRFKQSPDQSMISPENAEKIMHADVRIGDGVVLMSDGMCTGTTKFEGIALSFTVPDEAAAESGFNALAEGGSIQMPLTQTFFSPRFGMLQDKFGVGWMIYVALKEAYRAA